jgi:putative addiction module component (TIGR02574 family)
MSLTEIERAVSSLSVKERGTLAAHLLDSLPPHDGEDASQDGIAEAARRRDELNEGRVRALSSEEFWADIRHERAE